MITDPITLLFLSFAVLFTLLLLGVPIAISLAAIGVGGLYVMAGNATLINQIPYRVLDSFILTAIPLFIFMGEMLVKSGASEMVYRGASRLLGWLPGGLLHSNIAACAMFGAISGSSPATAATIGTVAAPALKKQGYNLRLTLGSLAAGGTLGILIPPSINMIVYGVVSGQSVGRMFAAGVVPGLLLSAVFMIYIGIRASANKALTPKGEPFTLRSVALSFFDLWPLYVIAIVVLGGIFGGIMTPSEAAAVGALASIVMAIAMRRFSFEVLSSSLKSALSTSCMVLFIVVGSSIMAAFFSRAGIPQVVSAMIVDAGIPDVMVFAAVCAMFIVLGFFIDPVSIILLTAPTVIPIMSDMGFNLIWFGIIYVVTAEIGMITPPMGLNLFVIQGISRERISEVILGSAPFFGLMTMMLVVFYIFPEIVLWLPNLIFGAQ
jgi:C4-dicarboxylate transporter, DctM subunit